MQICRTKILHLSSEKLRRIAETRPVCNFTCFATSKIDEHHNILAATILKNVLVMD